MKTLDFLLGALTLLTKPRHIRIIEVVQEAVDGKKVVVLRYRDTAGEGDWLNKLVTVAFKEDVDYHGKQTGGIRVIGCPDLAKPLTVEVPRPHRKPEVYTLRNTRPVQPQRPNLQAVA